MEQVADNERQRVSHLETLAQVVMNVDWDLVGKLVEFDSSLSRNKANGTLEYPEYPAQQRATLVGILQQRFDELATIPRATDPKDLDDQAPPTETDLQMARLAVALWQLGNTAAANFALRDEPDPTLKTQFIFGLARQQLNLPWLVEELEQRFQQGNNESPALFGLLQVLWLIPTEHLASTVNREWLDTLWLTSADNGVHAMAGLLLRKLGATPTPLTPGSYGNWRVENVGPLQIELAVISKQAFTGGISLGSKKYSGNEAWPLYRGVIERDYAIGLQEVTYQQYREFEPEFHAKKPGDIAIFNLNDQQVFVFCNWCSTQQGLELCYEKNEALNKWIPRVDYQKLNGYRLPTEDEWECACRSGTITGRFFGQNSTSPLINDGKLYPQYFQYGWLIDRPRLVPANDTSLPVGQLLPNRWGLFDTYGNVRELCSVSNHESHRDPEMQMVTVQRCASFWDEGAGLAVSHARSIGITDRLITGFRLVRTLPE